MAPGAQSALRHRARLAAVAVRRRLPAFAKPPLRAAGDRLDPILVRRYRKASGYRGPIPRRRLRARVGEPDVRRFVEQGREVTGVLMRAAEAAGTSLITERSVLDFGCGCGRNLLGLSAERQGRPGLVGCDVDREAITWLDAATGPAARCVVNDFTPPLPFDDSAFDVLYSVSILTHLDEASQDRWLAEIERVLTPGGIALISLQGEHAYSTMRSSEGVPGITPGVLGELRSRTSLAEEGFVFVEYERNAGVAAQFPGIAGAYGLAFQHPARVRERWTGRFDVVDHRTRVINHWQDLVTVRKRSGGRRTPGQRSAA